MRQCHALEVEVRMKFGFRSVFYLIAAVVMSVSASLSTAQSAYPTRPIKLVAPFPPGGTSDVLARVIAKKLGEALGQPITVDNKPGASGNIGHDFVAKSAPDGYTIVITNTGDTTAQWISRTWHINDANGVHEKVRGLGVVGHQPLIQPGEQFEYTSWVQIDTPTGRMEGTFYCMSEDAFPFETPVPAFDLIFPGLLH